MFPYLFFFTLIIGVILCISSDSWLGVWCGLELNLMSFVPFIFVEKNLYSSEASLKYFLVQALGSSFIVLGAVVYNFLLNFMVIITLALILKLGAAPFHFWFPQVIEGLSWRQSLVLMTIQKVAPMYLLTYLVIHPAVIKVLVARVIASAIVGGIGGINQILLRKLLAYSSINHISWMLLALIMRENSWLLYFIFYALISGSIVILLHSCQAYHFNQLIRFNKPELSILRFLSLLSLGGLPPFSGFLPKWFLIQEMVNQKFWFLLLILLLRSLLTLYYYLRVRLIYLNVSLVKFKWRVKVPYLGKNNLFVVRINFLGLFLPSAWILV